MANDRLYIRCLKCGEAFMLAKYWGYDYSTWGDAYEERLVTFLRDHTLTCGMEYLSLENEGGLLPTKGKPLDNGGEKC